MHFFAGCTAILGAVGIVLVLWSYNNLFHFDGSDLRERKILLRGLSGLFTGCFIWGLGLWHYGSGVLSGFIFAFLWVFGNYLVKGDRFMDTAPPDDNLLWYVIGLAILMYAWLPASIILICWWIGLFMFNAVRDRRRPQNSHA